MRQLDLFGFSSETPSVEKVPEKKQVVIKEETAQAADKTEERPYSLVDLAEEVLNSNRKEENPDLKKTPVFYLKPEQEKITDKTKASIEITAFSTTEINTKPKNAGSNEVLTRTESSKKTIDQTKKQVNGDAQLKTLPSQSKGSVVFDDGKITVKIKGIVAPPPDVPKVEKATRNVQKRGRKSFKEIDSELDLIEVPEDEVLFQKQYYPISEVAKWFRVNTSLLRFWENEFDVLKPKKNRKGDRLFRPEDVKNIELIYQLLRERKFTIEGAKEFIRTNKKKADTQLQLTNTLKKFRSFLLDLKANMGE